MLGTWQGIFLFEHRRDTPEREIALAPDRRMSLGLGPRVARASMRPTFG